MRLCPHHHASPASIHSSLGSLSGVSVVLLAQNNRAKHPKCNTPNRRQVDLHDTRKSATRTFLERASDRQMWGVMFHKCTSKHG